MKDLDALRELAVQYTEDEVAGEVLELGWALTERAGRDGAVVLWKFDGQRDTRQFTVVATGGALEETPLRCDAHTLERALAVVFTEYAALVWQGRK